MQALKKNAKAMGSRVRKLIVPNREKEIKLPTLPKGTPPGDMDPHADDEWWDICRDESAPGIEHPGIYPGCMECYTMCASHPATVGPEDIASCLTRTLNLCVIPEVLDEIQKIMDYINPPETCSPWSQYDPNTWESDTCRDPIACSNECQRYCPTQGYNNGQCETLGDTYYCNCY
jgi:hypothetical protein